MIRRLLLVCAVLSGCVSLVTRAEREHHKDRDGDGVQGDRDCDDDDPEVGLLFAFADLDGDGFGDPSAAIEACEVPSGHAGRSDDCDDTRAHVFPGAPEICDGRDSDCDATTTDAGIAIGGTGHANLGDALSAAVDGDVVSLCDAVVTGGQRVGVPNLTIIGVGPIPTVIDGLGDDTTLTIEAAGTGARLESVSLIGGQGLIGGGLAIEGARVTLQDVQVTGNSASSAGGISLGVDSALTLVRSQVADNVADRGGGLLVEQGATVSLDEASAVEGNTATGSGGGVYSVSSNLIWSGGTIADNTAGSNGGGLSTRGGTLDGVQVSGNVARVGAGLELRVGLLELVGVRIEDNVADDEGGGVSIGPGGRLIGVPSADIVANSAPVGGGVAIQPASAALTSLENVVVEGNTADAGGGVHVAAGGSDATLLVLAGLELAGNTASVHGGGARLLSDVTLSGSTIEHNNPGFEVASCSPSDDPTVARQGGGLSLEDVTVIIDDVRVADNVACRAGGLMTSGTVTVSSLQANLDVAGNRARRGGGASVATSDDLTVAGAQFDANTADETGGALHCSGSCVLTDTTMTDNAATQGGAVWLCPACTLKTTGQDWGVAIETNQPEAVYFVPQSFQFAGQRDVCCTPADGQCTSL